MLTTFAKYTFYRSLRISLYAKTNLRKDFYVTSKYCKQLSNNYCSDKNASYFASTGVENLFTYKTIKNALKFPNDQVNPLIEDILNSLGSNDEMNSEDKILVANKLKCCSDEELVKLLIIIEKVERSEKIKQFIKLIDLEGSIRIPKANPSIVLAGAVQLFILRMNYRSEWIWSCLKRFCRRLDKLSSPEVLQVMFLINLSRKIPEQYSGFDVQHNLVQHIDNFTLDELSVVSVAFFKSETKMNNSVIMSKIMRKLLNEAETCGDITIGLICKIIKYSLPIELSEELLLLQDKLVKQVPRIQLRSLTHVALAGTNVLVCHEPLIRAVIDQVRNILPQIRLKDMERLLFVLSLYNIHDTDFKERVIKELENREEEINKFPKAIVSLVNYLIILKCYKQPLINRVLSDHFVANTYVNYKKIGGELIFIDKSVEIEYPEYQGNRLSQKMSVTSAKIMTFKRNAIVTGTQKFSYEIEDILTQIYGKEKNAFLSILPHFHFPDFVLRFNSNLVAQSIPEDLRPHRWGDIKKAPDDKHIWLCLIVGGWNTLIRGSEVPLGTTLTKMRQVGALGYHPLLIPYFSYRNSKDKLNFVKNRIDGTLKNIDVRRSVETN